jgi:hypothetical protein
MFEKEKMFVPQIFGNSFKTFSDDYVNVTKNLK